MFFLNWFKMFKVCSVLTIFPTNSKPFFILLHNLPLIIFTAIEKTYDHTVTNAHRLAYLNPTDVGQITWDNIDGLWY